MKKESNTKKGSKGFYAALGISAVMIGSACFFAYDQGEKLNNKNTADNIISVPEAPVDKKTTGIPKTTTIPIQTTAPVYTTAAAVTTTPTITAAVSVETLPAADIVKSDPPAESENIEETENSAQVNSASNGASKLENVKPPLSDMSNIINPFSGSELVKNETTGSWQTHNGTDFAAEVGTEVFSISSGEVTKIDTDQLWGVCVTINHHNGYVSKYCSLGADLSVQEGDLVASGAVIGVVGQTADIESAVAPHLHIELQHNGAYVDPLSAIKE
ncbi:MAG: M23 family metallopeptidase [Ruminococcus flavefaciens]|nr:M23 family metallopeptidase [Ruminococcus flavefaciens]MCM1362899.1 M23 family metallopeptidase [Clostridiales bacterium]MCM1435805.1 M23 family metallopeptidase [Ruminococcus flavefaciens]